MRTIPQLSSVERDVHAIWAYYGGKGDPPPLIVTLKQYEDFKAAGLPEHMMLINKMIELG